MPCAFAMATIDWRSPPLDLLTYQIHISYPSNSLLPVGRAPLAAPRATFSLTALERAPPGTCTYNRPEYASRGTRAISVRRLVARVFDERAAVTPAAFTGKTARMPLAKPVP